MYKFKVKSGNFDINTYEPNTTFQEISKDFRDKYTYPILIAKVNNYLTPLTDKITRDSEVIFYDRSSEIGHYIYENTLQFLMIYSIKMLLGDDTEVIIEHSIDNGVYCEVVNKEMTPEVVNELEILMHKHCEDDLEIKKVSVSRSDASYYFSKKNQIDKVKALKYISNANIHLYRLGNIYDYFYSGLAASTKLLDEFKLTYIDTKGFVIRFPNITNPECTLEYNHYGKVFEKYEEYIDWCDTVEIRNAADLNEFVTTHNYNDLIRISEAKYNSQLADVSNKIADSDNDIKLVLIAGPSSSGKTTTSKKLEVYLRSQGITAHQISIDDYFLDRKDTPRNHKGEYDFESVNAIDLEAFNRDMMRLLDGERVLLPEYNFVVGKKEYKRKWLQLKKNTDIIIVEGLHALNDKLTMLVDSKNKYKIYLTPLSPLNVDNHSRVHTTDIRKLRRMIRDSRTRGNSASDTLTQWNKIREGENKYIYPYIESSDVVINSALLYEISVLKIYAEPLLFSIDENNKNYPEALRLINFLRNFLPLSSEEVPNDSVLREFIGNSCFHN